MSGVDLLVSDESDLRVFCTQLRDQSSKTQELGLASLVTLFQSHNVLAKLAAFFVNNAVAEVQAPQELLLLDTFSKKGLSACLRAMLINGFLSTELAPVISEVKSGFAFEERRRKKKKEEERRKKTFLLNTYNNLLNTYRCVCLI